MRSGRVDARLEICENVTMACKESLQLKCRRGSGFLLLFVSFDDVDSQVVRSNRGGGAVVVDVLLMVFWWFQ